MALSICKGTIIIPISSENKLLELILCVEERSGLVF